MQALVFFKLIFVVITITSYYVTQIKTANSDDKQQQQQQQLWPNKQLNVLIDTKSLNGSEQEIIEIGLEQIEHKTCILVNRLKANKVNPFDLSGRQLGEREKNFIYLFKSHIGLYNRPPTIGLSTFGCALKGRQSIILTESAFRWPKIVLRYHLLRSLGVPNLRKPQESELAELESQQLPISQKISTTSGPQNGSLVFGKQKQSSAQAMPFLIDVPPISYFAYASGPQSNESHLKSRRELLSDEDLRAIKILYDCPDYQNRLSVKPPPPQQLVAEVQPVAARDIVDIGEKSAAPPPERPSRGNSGSLMAKKLKNAEESLKQIISSVADEKGTQIDGELVTNAAKSIVHYLLAELEGQSMDPTTNEAIKQDGQQLEGLLNSLEHNDRIQCKPPELCPVDNSSSTIKDHQERSTRNDNSQRSEIKRNSSDPSGISNNNEQLRPMLLKLDEYHANDPQLKQANQMKLSQLTNGGGGDSTAVPQTYRLLNNANPSSSTPQQRQLLDPYGGGGSQQQQQQQQQQPQLQPMQPQSGNGKSEMMISFEQTNNPDAKNPIDALTGSQVLKLCSCTCQTMTPSAPSGLPLPSSPSLPSPTLQPPTMPDTPPFTPPSNPITLPTLPTLPTYPTYPNEPSGSTFPPWTVTDFPSIPSGGPSGPSWPPTNPQQPDETGEQPWSTWPPSPPTVRPIPTKDTYPTETFTYAPTDTMPAPSRPPTTTQKPTTATTISEPQPGGDDDENDLPAPPPPPSPPPGTTPAGNNSSWSMDNNGCDQVQWVKPNKTVYSSAQIVWDVDRANQNYFLCQAKLDSGELVPGKTHGLSCKVSSKGIAYEMHQFKVLIKPEFVSLAWVQKDSKSFGTGKNWPVIGGYSKANSKAAAPQNGDGGGGGSGSGDPYVVSRCLVRDENNDVITLIGYINRKNVGWFPFDDIQIECAQYDVLACVN